MNDLLRERAAQDRLKVLYAQAEASRQAAACRPSRPRRLYQWSVWLGHWGVSVVLHHQG